VLRRSYAVLNKGIDCFTLNTPRTVLGKDIPIVTRILVILREDKVQCLRFSFSPNSSHIRQLSPTRTGLIDPGSGTGGDLL